MITAAIIGMGNWGRTLVDSVQASQAIRFTHGATRTQAKVTAWAAARGITVLESLDAVLATPEIDAVVLATPHTQHATQVVAAARAGKHVFVEKPFTLSKREALAAAEACRAAGRVLALGHNRRFLPAIDAIKRMLAAAELGTICHVDANISGPGALNYRPESWRNDREESPLGGMGGMGIHMVDCLINLLGPVESVLCISHGRAGLPIDDTTAMLLRFASGATGSLTTVAATARIWRFQLLGTKAHLEMRDPQTIVVQPVAGARLTTEWPVVESERMELEAFAAACAGGPAYPLPVEQAVHGAAVFQALIASAEQGGWMAVP